MGRAGAGGAAWPPAGRGGRGSGAPGLAARPGPAAGPEGGAGRRGRGGPERRRSHFLAVGPRGGREAAAGPSAGRVAAGRPPGLGGGEGARPRPCPGGSRAGGHFWIRVCRRLEAGPGTGLSPRRARRDPGLGSELAGESAPSSPRCSRCLLGLSRCPLGPRRSGGPYRARVTGGVCPRAAAPLSLPFAVGDA